MRYVVASFLLLLSSACGAPGVEEQVLPNWATPEELEQASQMPPALTAPDSVPPQQIRLPAEFEPHRAVVITYAAFTPLLDSIARNVAASGAEVWAVGGPASITGVPAAQYKRLGFAYNSVWSRDYGPFGIDEATGALAITDTTYRHYLTRTADDAVPCEVAGYAGASCYHTKLILDGGNIMSDGEGNVFVTRRIYTWNSTISEAEVDQLLRDYLGAKTIHKFAYATTSRGAPADGTGHIDMFAKIVKPCTVIVAQTTNTTFKPALEAAATYFAGLACAPQRNYQVLRVPGYYTGGTWYTYTNSLIVNDHVLVPSYRNGNDAGAKKVYQQALPGYTVAMMPSDDIIKLGGSVHCVTKEIPATTR